MTRLAHGGRPPERPVTVSVAGALTAVAGAANVVVGVVLGALVTLGALPLSGGVKPPTLLLVASGYCALGAVTLLCVPSVLGGSPRARVAVTALMTIRIVMACVSFGLLGTWFSAGSVVGVVLSIVVVALLWDSRANAYFHHAGSAA